MTVTTPHVTLPVFVLQLHEAHLRLFDVQCLAPTCELSDPHLFLRLHHFTSSSILVAFQRQYLICPRRYAFNVCCMRSCSACLRKKRSRVGLPRSPQLQHKRWEPPRRILLLRSRAVSFILSLDSAKSLPATSLQT